MAHPYQAVLASRPELPGSPPPTRLRPRGPAPTQFTATAAHRGAPPRGPPQSA
jgi:hypothetical protein